MPKGLRTGGRLANIEGGYFPPVIFPPFSIYRKIFQVLIEHPQVVLGLPGGLAGEESACNVGDLGWIPGLTISPAEGKGYPLQYSSLGNSMGCIVRGAAKSQTQLSDYTQHSSANTALITTRTALGMFLASISSTSEQG